MAEKVEDLIRARQQAHGFLEKVRLKAGLEREGGRIAGVLGKTVAGREARTSPLKRAGDVWTIEGDGGRRSNIVGRDVAGNKRRKQRDSKARQPFEGQGPAFGPDMGAQRKPVEGS